MDSGPGSTGREVGEHGGALGHPDAAVSARPLGPKTSQEDAGLAARRTLDALISVVPDLARALGPDHEVVVHDLSLIPNSIVAIGGAITGRRVGGPITDLLLRALRQGQTDSVFRYQARTTDGRTLNSSTVFIKDLDGNPVGCLCVNRNITELLGMHALCEQLASAAEVAEVAEVDSGPSAAAATDQPVEQETFALTVEEMALSLVDQTIQNVGVEVDLMQKRHKVQVIRNLEAGGLFLLRDGVDLTARMLGISRESVYNYLKEARQESAQGTETADRRRENRRRLNLSDSEPTIREE